MVNGRRRASISHSSYTLCACSETVIELERMRTIQPEQDFWFRFSILSRALARDEINVDSLKSFWWGKRIRRAKADVCLLKL